MSNEPDSVEGRSLEIERYAMAYSAEELYLRYGAIVLRRAWSILGEEQAALDATQEVFEHALRSQREFRNASSPLTWLYRMTTNHCLNVLRDEKRRRVLLESNPWLRAGDVTPPLDDQLAVGAILARVPEELRAYGIYFYLDQLSHEEIAELLDVSPRTVAYRLEAFREACREQLAWKEDR